MTHNYYYFVLLDFIKELTEAGATEDERFKAIIRKYQESLRYVRL